MPLWVALTRATVWASTVPASACLNVGTEEHKGRAEIKAAHDLIAEMAAAGELEFVGFVEGGDIPSNASM